MLREMSVSVWDCIHEACACELYSPQTDRHSPIVLVLLNLCTSMVQKKNSENGMFVLCGKDPYLSEKKPILKYLKPRTARELP